MLAIEQFERAARRFPDRPVVVAPPFSMTYRDMSALVDKIGNALVASGLEPGAKISILSQNHPMVLACQYAILKAGCIWIPSNFRNLPADTARQFQALDVSFVFCHSSFESHIEAIREQIPAVRRVVSIDEPTATAPGLAEWSASFPPGAATPSRKMDDTVAIITTGGTTGLPKGAVHTNRTFECNIAGYQAMLNFHNPCVHLVVAPLTHAAGVLHWALVNRGATHVLCPTADPEAILSMIEKYRVNLLFLPPTIIYMLLSYPNLKKYDYSSLEYFLFGAAPMSVDKLKEATAAFGPVMTQIYGSTETLIMNTILTREETDNILHDSVLQHRLASAGREGPLSRVEIIDDDGNLVAPGERGEIVIRGEFVMSEYYKDPARTGETRINGWHRTGDIGYKDHDGYVFIVDRKNDMIISGGFNIYPAEVEQAVLSHPAVQDCAVVGIPHDKWGEAVLAAVELKAGHTLDQEEFLAFCKSRLGSVKAPKYLEVLDTMPRSTVGKTLRRVVRARYWEGRDHTI
jgi:acyl-CoA synthetase (AMP-forming)/AMP-acid ligase II